MIKILFLIHDLGHGGAEKVLVNLVNNMDPEKFDITVMALFGGGVNEQFLKPHIRYQTVFSRTFRGNSHLMKLLPPGSCTSCSSRSTTTLRCLTWRALPPGSSAAARMRIRSWYLGSTVQCTLRSRLDGHSEIRER